jgi:hypothetical protein
MAPPPALAVSQPSFPSSPLVAPRPATQASPLASPGYQVSTAGTGAGFLVDYELKESWGVGVFTRQFIPKGTLIWKFDADVNIRRIGNQKDYHKYLSNLGGEEACYFELTHMFPHRSFVNQIRE